MVPRTSIPKLPTVKTKNVKQRGWTLRSQIRRLGKFSLLCWHKTCLLLDLVAESIRTLLRGPKKEEPKVVLQKTRWPKVRKCLIHVVPWLTTGVLVSLNLATFFVGREYEGRNEGVWQNFDAYALQIAAKLFELFIIASLATVLLDMLRRELLQSTSGLPFGLIAARACFGDVTYIISADFLSGLRGFPLPKAILYGFTISLFSGMALLAGPSSAILAIPQMLTDWKMGGAQFFLLGSAEQLWPSNLDDTAIGPSICQSVTVDRAISEQIDTGACIWAGFSSISDYFAASMDSPVPFSTMTMRDSNVIRNIPIDSALVATVHLSTIIPAEALTQLWFEAIINAPKAQLLTLSKYTNVRNRVRNTNTYRITGQVPIVQTNCNLNQSVTFSKIPGQVYYPLQSKGDGHVDGGARYNFSDDIGTTTNGSIATYWFDSSSIIANSSDSTQEDFYGNSSAYLNVLIPSTNTSQRGVIIACSLDARWVRRDTIGTGGSAWENAIYEAENAPTAGFTDKLGAYGRRVHLESEWLYALTPRLANGTNGYNLLSVLLQQIGISKIASQLDLGDGGPWDWDWGLVRTKTETTVSAWVADAMSRAAFSLNFDVAQMGIYDNTTTEDQRLNQVLEDRYSLQLFNDTTANGTERSRLTWSVNIAGLGYRATTTPYYLAIALLLTHTVITICHTIWTFFVVKDVSSAWSSLTDLLSLALVSLPPDPSVLSNASVGVEQHANFRKAIRIRVTNQDSSGGSSADSSHSADSQHAASNAGGLELRLGQNPSSGTADRVVIGQKY